VASLRAHGVDTVFGLPGAQTYELYDAFARDTSGLRIYGVRHEQTAAYMAFGYAKASGRPGVCTVVPGPGVLNAGAALCTAYGTSMPVLCVTAEVPRAFIGSGKGHLHELPDQLALLRGLTKWSERIDDVSRAPELMAQAFRQLASGRPRPVAIEVPWDVFGIRGPRAAVLRLPALPALAADTQHIEAAAKLLAAAKNPMLMVGGGAQHARAEVIALAEHLQAPVVSFRGGRGIVPDDHYLGFNCACGFARWAEADVLVGIGSRLELQWFRWPDQPERLKIVLLDVDPQQMTRLNPTIAVVGDAQLATADLLAAVQRLAAPRASRADEWMAVKARVAERTQVVQPQLAYLAAIRDVLPRDGFFVEEISQVGFASHFGFPIYEPRTFVTAGHQGTLGFGFPTALGVKVAFPHRSVVSIVGDGGLMFAIGEFATAVQHGINVVTVLFNNNSYGNVRRDQLRLYQGRTLGAELSNPDFVKLAESFGVHAERVKSPARLRSALERAFAANCPALIEVPVERGAEYSPWEFTMPPSSKAS
ncbi:MAG TPA: thiamine pyrophosphate-dependent enzyme, partial [Steroidobacteraceae bacterium]